VVTKGVDRTCEGIWLEEEECGRDRVEYVDVVDRVYRM
jgi:hypothetical protein